MMGVRVASGFGWLQWPIARDLGLLDSRLLGVLQRWLLGGEEET